ncbi:MAG: ATP-binding protein [Chloroflexota bacterium]
MRGFRARLLATIVGLVALTALTLGVGAYAYVATQLRDQERASAVAQTNFNVAVLADERLSAAPTRDEVVADGLFDAFALRGGVDTIVDFGEGDPLYSGLAPAATFDAVPPAVRAIVASGRIGYDRISVDGHPYLVTGARRPGTGPAFYFLFDAAATEAAIATLGQALLVGGLVAVVLAIVVAGAVARGLLRPVRDAGRAAERIADGDFSTRLPIATDDEFGSWARSFNRMAGSLATTIAELQRLQARQRAFVSDVSHELRTPVTALVQEAALLRDHIDQMPRDARRAGELLVVDVARLRTLVDELMEISRFDAAAETVADEEADLVALVRRIATDRASRAELRLPAEPIVLLTDRRRIERIVGNLLDNAREHGGEAEVVLELRRRADEVVLTVGDRGPGVDPAELPYLFDRFHKADPSRHVGGSGLGLAIAREHAELLGGTLGARLRDGGGLVFELTLPVTEPLPAGDEPVTDEDDAEARIKTVSEPRP